MASLGILCLGFQALQAFADGCKVLLVGGSLGHILSPELDAYVGLFDLSLDAAAALLGPLFQGLVVGQVEHLGEDFLAFRGGAGREHVGLALEQEGRVHEGVVVQVQDAADVLLGLPDGVERDGGEASARPEGHFQDCVTLGSAPGVPAADPVSLGPRRELQLDGHVPETLVDQVVLPAGAGLAPQGPRDAVEEGGLAVAVVAGEAGDVDALQV